MHDRISFLRYVDCGAGASARLICLSALLEVQAVPEKRAGIQGTVSGQYSNHGIGSQRGIFRGECAARDCPGSVSYTHLDVYKRQIPGCAGGGRLRGDFAMPELGLHLIL